MVVSEQSLAAVLDKNARSLNTTVMASRAAPW